MLGDSPPPSRPTHTVAPTCGRGAGLCCVPARSGSVGLRKAHVAAARGPPGAEPKVARSLYTRIKVESFTIRILANTLSY